MKLYSLYILKNADQDIILTLLHQKDRHIQHVRIWCFERNTVWLKEGLILVWKEDCSSSERKHCMFRGMLYFCMGTVSWTKSYFVWKENCSLWMKVILFKHAKEGCNLKQIASFKKWCAFWPEYVLIFLKVIVYLLCFCKRFPTNTTSLTSTKS